MKKSSVVIGLTVLIVLAAAAGLPFVSRFWPAAPATNNAALVAQQPLFSVQASDEDYTAGAHGYYARPADGGSYPGVVMIHEWWGMNDHIKDMARELAGQGYAVLAVDLYGEVATSSDRARALSSGIDQTKATANMKAATTFLRDRGATRIASLGWCFGGGQSLQLALSGEQLDATVIYYGRLTDDQTRLRAITSPVLGIFGDKDQSISVDSVRAFEAGLTAVGIENEVIVYPGVGHAFANPSGQSYAPVETKDAWAETLAFLKQYLAE